MLALALFVAFGAMTSCSLFEPKQVAQGRKLFSRFCAPCHGEGGSGDGYNAKNLDPHPRDLTDKIEKYMAKLTNDEIFEVISVGGRGVDLSPLMPSWEKTFSEEERWSLVAFVRTLHPSDAKKIVLDATKPSTYTRMAGISEAEYLAMAEAITDDTQRAPLTEKGEELFGDFGCIACHRVHDKGGVLGPDLTRAGFMLQPQFIYRWVRNPQSFKPHTRMPNLGVPEEDAFAIVQYLSTLNGPPLAQVSDASGSK